MQYKINGCGIALATVWYYFQNIDAVQMDVE